MLVCKIFIDQSLYNAVNHTNAGHIYAFNTSPFHYRQVYFAGRYNNIGPILA